MPDETFAERIAREAKADLAEMGREPVGIPVGKQSLVDESLVDPGALTLDPAELTADPARRIMGRRAEAQRLLPAPPPTTTLGQHMHAAAEAPQRLQQSWEAFKRDPSLHGADEVVAGAGHTLIGATGLPILFGPIGAYADEKQKTLEAQQRAVAQGASPEDFEGPGVVGGAARLVGDASVELMDWLAKPGEIVGGGLDAVGIPSKTARLGADVYTFGKTAQLGGGLGRATKGAVLDRMAMRPRLNEAPRIGAPNVAETRVVRETESPLSAAPRGPRYDEAPPVQLRGRNKWLEDIQKNVGKELRGLDPKRPVSAVKRTSKPGEIAVRQGPMPELPAVRESSPLEFSSPKPEVTSTTGTPLTRPEGRTSLRTGEAQATLKPGIEAKRHRPREQAYEEWETIRLEDIAENPSLYTQLIDTATRPLSRAARSVSEGTARALPGDINPNWLLDLFRYAPKNVDTTQMFASALRNRAGRMRVAREKVAADAMPMHTELKSFPKGVRDKVYEYLAGERAELPPAVEHLADRLSSLKNLRLELSRAKADRNMLGEESLNLYTETGQLARRFEAHEGQGQSVTGNPMRVRFPSHKKDRPWIKVRARLGEVEPMKARDDLNISSMTEEGGVTLVQFENAKDLATFKAALPDHIGGPRGGVGKRIVDEMDRGLNAKERAALGEKRVPMEEWANTMLTDLGDVMTYDFLDMLGRMADEKGPYMLPKPKKGRPIPDNFQLVSDRHAGTWNGNLIRKDIYRATQAALKGDKPGPWRRIWQGFYGGVKQNLTTLRVPTHARNLRSTVQFMIASKTTPKTMMKAVRSLMKGTKEHAKYDKVMREWDIDQGAKYYGEEVGRMHDAFTKKGVSDRAADVAQFIASPGSTLLGRPAGALYNFPDMAMRRGAMITALEAGMHPAKAAIYANKFTVNYKEVGTLTKVWAETPITNAFTRFEHENRRIRMNLAREHPAEFLVNEFYGWAMNQVVKHGQRMLGYPEVSDEERDRIAKDYGSQAIPVVIKGKDGHETRAWDFRFEDITGDTNLPAAVVPLVYEMLTGERTGRLQPEGPASVLRDPAMQLGAHVIGLQESPAWMALQRITSQRDQYGRPVMTAKDFESIPDFMKALGREHVRGTQMTTPLGGIPGTTMKGSDFMRLEAAMEERPLSPSSPVQPLGEALLQTGPGIRLINTDPKFVNRREAFGARRATKDALNVELQRKFRQEEPDTENREAVKRVLQEMLRRRSERR